jgi:hypothetical protein
LLITVLNMLRKNPGTYPDQGTGKIIRKYVTNVTYFSSGMIKI